MKELFIDAETYSDIDLSKSGVYRYVSSPNFEILLLAISVDDEPTKVYDLKCGDKLPIEIIEAIKSKDIKKWSFNASFERIVLSKYLGMEVGNYLDPASWYCDMVASAYLGLPLSLENVGYVLGLEKQKLSVGKELIRYFCKPCEPTKRNGGRTRNLPEHAPEKWALMKEYNARDVDTQKEIHNRIKKFPMPEREWEYYHLNERIQDYGIALDMDFVTHAINCDEINSESNLERATEITGVDNPNSPKQLKEWLIEQGMMADSLAKSEVKRLLEGATGSVQEILKLRQELAKSSIKKYKAMENVVCPDSRARGLIQFYGANRTGRFAGRLIQVQNLVSNKISDLEYARKLVTDENLDEIQARYGSISNVLSECIRTAFIPKKGHRFIVADYSQIEARVLSFISNSTDNIEHFAKGDDIYSLTASKMFGKEVTKTNENHELRKYGKIATLACGYGGGIGALRAFGAIALGIKESELQGIVNSWRNANPNIVKMWWDIDKATKHVASTGEEVSLYGLTISYARGIMFIKLPSGRSLCYCKPRMGINNFGSECVRYEGIGVSKKWELLDSYGPKFVENITQAIARDILCEAMDRLEKKGYHIVMTVHDEVVLEVPDGESSIEEVCSIMKENPSWLNNFPSACEGYECQFYKKE
jgi:DNA polymerase